MGNCIRTEMWKAFHNKMMRSALLIGFILVIADLVQTAITVSDLGASYAHSPGGYDGCSLFVNWIGVNGNYGSVCIRDGMSRLYSSGCTAYYRILFRHSLFGEAILYPPLAACNHLVRY